jgi:hypothetical protein
MSRTTQSKQRRLERLIREDEQSIDDSAFFARNPDRNFRVRLATSHELAAVERAGGTLPPLAEDRFWWTAIKQLAPGVRVFLHVEGPAPIGAVPNIDEATAREIFRRTWGKL